MQRFVLALLICLGLGAWSPGVDARVARMAIIVGANKAPPGRVDLRYAHDDARAVAQVLTLVGEFAAQDVETLIEPTPERVLSAIDAKVARLGGASESLVFFYYSGHSDSDALYPNGQPLLLSALQQRLDDPRVTVRLGLIDSCRGGAWTGAKGLQETALFDVSPASALRNVGSVLIASSSGLEDAHESEALGGSFFTHHFNAALRGAADENEDAQVSLVEAFEYAKALTIRDTALVASAPQHPSFRMNLQGRQDLPLSNLQRGESWMALAQNEGPLQVVHLQSGLVLIELQPGARDVRVAVPPGRYLVRRRDGGQTYAKEYDVKAGLLVSVGEADLELSGNAGLSIKGLDEREWKVNYHLFGGAGVNQGQNFAFAEAQHGRVSLNDTALTGLWGFAITNAGLGTEVSMPGRLGWRLGGGGGVEWVPWVGFPYYFVPNEEGTLRFHFGVGLGLDVWAPLDEKSKLGLNLGTSAFGDEDDSNAEVIRAWGSLGYARQLSDRWSITAGVGYARNLLRNDEDGADGLTAEQVNDQVSLGSIMTDGVLPKPLLSYRALDSLSLGLSARVDYRLPDASLGYEVTFGWTWRFGQLQMTVK